MKKINKVLTIGYGSMGRPFIEPILNNPNIDLSVVTKTLRPPGHPQIKHYFDIREISNPFDMIVVSCKKQHIDSIIPVLPSNIHNDETLFVSIVQGITRDYYYNTLGSSTNIALMVPNLAVKKGKGIVGILYEEK